MFIKGLLILPLMAATVRKNNDQVESKARKQKIRKFEWVLFIVILPSIG